MKYEQLSKLYYKSREEYEETYNTRFAEGIKLGIMINGNPAFYVQDVEVYKKIISIQRINEHILEICQKLPPAALHRYADKCLIEEIVITNEIEGVQSTHKEIEEVLSDLEQKNKRHRFHGLVNKYRMLNDRETIELSSSKDVRALYNELVAAEIAEQEPSNLPDGELFRKETVKVVAPTQETVHVGVMPERAIIEAMDKALGYLNDDKEDIIIRTAVFHYLFGYIHPFYDGNGRLSRFISSYMLTKVLHPLAGYTLSYVIKDDINSYYKAFKACNAKLNKGDITPFIIMFVDVIEKACLQIEEDLLQKEIALQYLYKKTNELTEDGKLQKLFHILIQATLFSSSGAQTEELLSIFDVSRPTLNKRLSTIRDKGLLDEKMTDRAKYYKLRIDRL